jgi:hypothetical protein
MLLAVTRKSRVAAIALLWGLKGWEAIGTIRLGIDGISAELFILPEKRAVVRRAVSLKKASHSGNDRFSRRTGVDTPPPAPPAPGVLLSLPHCPQETGSAHPHAGRIGGIAAEAPYHWQIVLRPDT